MLSNIVNSRKFVVANDSVCRGYSLGLRYVNDVDFIAISTYNGIALRYANEIKDELERNSLDVPVLIGGRLNQIPDVSNTSLPVDVKSEIQALRFVACGKIEQMIPALLGLTKLT